MFFSLFNMFNIMWNKSCLQLKEAYHRSIWTTSFSCYWYFAITTTAEYKRCSRKWSHTTKPLLQESLTFWLKPYYPLLFKYISCILSPTFIFCIISNPKNFWIVHIFTHPIGAFYSSFWKQRKPLSSHGIQEPREGITELYTR